MGTLQMGKLMLREGRSSLPGVKGEWRLWQWEVQLGRRPMPTAHAGAAEVGVGG